MAGKPTNAQFILFAVAQAKAAIRFRFKQNEANRNLKTALYQYWQNKTLGLQPQSQKARIPRTVQAKGRPLSECVVEHVVPLQVIVNKLLAVPELTPRKVTSMLRRLYRVRLVTRAEAQRLDASGLRAAMPDDWDGRDVWARYRQLGIRVVGGHQ